MKAPKFWYQPKGLCAALLSPLGWLYGRMGRFLRACKPQRRFTVPILSVGNLVVGGSGKTPTAISIATLLQKKNLKICFVTRGYGGKLVGPVKVDLSHHTAQDVGDEALLLAQQAPTWVGKDRASAVQKACETRPDLIILDDGHQTSGVHKDLSFIVVDSLQGFGNGCVLPAGPLRESRDEGLKRADALVAIATGDRKQETGVRTSFLSPDTCLLTPVFQAHLVPTPLSLTRAVAFCGLGFPQKFFKTLASMGIELASTLPFPDHHFYTEKDLRHLEALSRTHEAPLITTRKDWVKLSPPWQQKVHVLDVALCFDDPDEFYTFIIHKIPRLGSLHG